MPASGPGAGTGGDASAVGSIRVREVAVDHDSTLELAAATGPTAYDASYLWLAEKLGTELFTLDRHLAKAKAASSRVAGEGFAGSINHEGRSQS